MAFIPNECTKAFSYGVIISPKTRCNERHLFIGWFASYIQTGKNCDFLPSQIVFISSFSMDCNALTFLGYKYWLLSIHGIE